MGSNKYNAEQLVKKIKRSTGSKHNRDIVLDFYHEWLAAGVCHGTLTNYLKVLCRLVVYADNKQLEKLTKSDLVDFFMNLKPCNSGIGTANAYYAREVIEYSPHTLIRMKANIKVFWKWMLQTTFFYTQIFLNKKCGQAIRE